MRNPFDLNQNDAEFIAASRTKNARQAKIARLSVARSWSFVSMVLLSGFMGLLMALDLRHFLDHNQLSLWLWILVPSFGSFIHLDLQVKFLKALESEDRG